MTIDAIQAPTSCFMQRPKSKTMCKIGKAGVKIGTYQALKSVESRFFIPYILVTFEQGKYSKLLPECCKMALFVAQFKKNSEGSMPLDPLVKAPTFGNHFVVTKKIPYFQRIPLGETEK